jgi:hypothetical protein
MSLLAAGCFDGDEAGTSAPAPSTEAAKTVTPLVTAVVVYPLSTPHSHRGKVGETCPRGASCAVVAVREWIGTPSGTHRATYWVRRARMQLRCGPPGGGYSDPVAACDALQVLRRAMRHRMTVCACPLMLPNVRPRVTVTTASGARRMLHLDACSLCGLGKEAYGAAQLLMPTA